MHNTVKWGLVCMMETGILSAELEAEETRKDLCPTWVYSG